jgi:hypothetical protein
MKMFIFIFFKPSLLWGGGPSHLYGLYSFSWYSDGFSKTLNFIDSCKTYVIWNS